MQVRLRTSWCTLRERTVATPVYLSRSGGAPWRESRPSFASCHPVHYAPKTRQGRPSQGKRSNDHTDGFCQQADVESISSPETRQITIICRPRPCCPGQPPLTPDYHDESKFRICSVDQVGYSQTGVVSPCIVAVMAGLSNIQNQAIDESFGYYRQSIYDAMIQDNR
nr:hypothetical protein CFP56_52780 [Quercus suber]